MAGRAENDCTERAFRLVQRLWKYVEIRLQISEVQIGNCRVKWFDHCVENDTINTRNFLQKQQFLKCFFQMN